MYYMQLQKSSKPQWPPAGLLGILRASLPAAPRNQATVETVPGSLAAQRPPVPLDSNEYLEVANAWRDRTSFGDLGAESVAQALELVANHRAAQKESRLLAMRRKIAELRELRKAGR